MTNGYSLHVRDRHTLIRIVVGVLAADGVAISLEGDLSHHRFPGDLYPSFEPNDLFKRNTTWPVQDFVILPLSPTTAPRALRAVLPGGHLPRGVLHVMVGGPTELLFISNDRFEQGAVAVTSLFPNEILDVLVMNGTLWSYAQFPAAP